MYTSIKNRNWTIGQRELAEHGTQDLMRQLAIRRDVLESCVRNGLYHFSREMDDVLEQMCLLENVTEEAQDEYFQKLNKRPRVIVTKSFAERWTTNPNHYKEYYHTNDVEVKSK